MTYTTSFLIATLITATVLMNTSTVLAQEWRVLLGQGIFQTDQLSQEMKKSRATKETLDKANKLLAESGKPQDPAKQRDEENRS